MFNKYKNIIIIVAVIGLAFVVYTFLFGGEKGAALSSQDVNPSQTAVEQELIALLLELRSIKLDVSLFDSEEFISLQDFSQELVPEPVGRTNPFAPLQ